MTRPIYSNLGHDAVCPGSPWPGMLDVLWYACDRTAERHYPIPRNDDVEVETPHVCGKLAIACSATRVHLALNSEDWIPWFDPTDSELYR